MAVKGRGEGSGGHIGKRLRGPIWDTTIEGQSRRAKKRWCMISRCSASMRIVGGI